MVAGKALRAQALKAAAAASAAASAPAIPTRQPASCSTAQQHSRQLDHFMPAHPPGMGTQLVVPLYSTLESFTAELFVLSSPVFGWHSLANCLKLSFSLSVCCSACLLFRLFVCLTICPCSFVCLSAVIRQECMLRSRPTRAFGTLEMQCMSQLQSSHS